MARFIISIIQGANLNEVIESIKKLSDAIVVSGFSPNDRGGLITIECPEDLARAVTKIQGVKNSEPEIFHHPV